MIYTAPQSVPRKPRIVMVHKGDVNAKIDPGSQKGLNR